MPLISFGLPSGSSFIQGSSMNNDRTFSFSFRCTTCGGNTTPPPPTDPPAALLDSPLVPYAGMSKERVWERFQTLLAAYEDDWIAFDENRRLEPPPWSALLASILDRQLPDCEANPHQAADAAWWIANEEPELRPTDTGAAVSVWLWLNGFHEQSVDLYAKIWQKVRDRQRHQGRILWNAESALTGFRLAADQDWNTENHAQFTALFRQRHVDPKSTGRYPAPPPSGPGLP